MTLNRKQQRFRDQLLDIRVHFNSHFAFKIELFLKNVSSSLKTKLIKQISSIIRTIVQTLHNRSFKTIPFVKSQLNRKGKRKKNILTLLLVATVRLLAPFLQLEIDRQRFRFKKR